MGLLRQTRPWFWEKFAKSLEPWARNSIEYSELEEAEGQSLSLIVELDNSARVAGWKPRGICLSLPSHSFDYRGPVFMWVLGFLMFVLQGLLLCHLHIPSDGFLVAVISLTMEPNL